MAKFQIHVQRGVDYQHYVIQALDRETAEKNARDALGSALSPRALLTVIATEEMRWLGDN